MVGEGGGGGGGFGDVQGGKGKRGKRDVRNVQKICASSLIGAILLVDMCGNVFAGLARPRHRSPHPPSLTPTTTLAQTFLWMS